MSYQRDREAFIARMTQEGLPLEVTRLLLREATGLQRRAELACSSEAADRDRVPCPESTGHGRPCLCDSVDDHVKVGTVPRIAVQDWRAEQRVRKALAGVRREVTHAGITGSIDTPWQLLTDGDPRGYVLKVIPPSYAARNAGRDRGNLEAIGVPAGPSRVRD